MIDPVNHAPLSPQPEIPAAPETVRDPYAELRSMLAMAVAAMLFLAFSMDLFVWYQFYIVRRELLELRPQMQQMAADFEKNQAPLINAMYSSLVVFGKSNPEFNGVLLRYNVIPAPPAATAPPPAR